MMFKKVCSITVVTCLALSLLLGCGSTSSNKNEKTKIVVWAMGEEGKKMGEVVAEFEEKTGYEVEVQAIPWDQAHNKLLTAVASKKGPDVIQLGTTWMPEFVEADVLVDLSKYMDKYPNLKPETFFEGSVATTQYNGKTYGTPLFTDTRLLFYRTDVLDSVGYKNPPATWKELKDVSTKLTARGDNFYGMNWDFKEQSLIFMLANQAGGKYYGADYNTDFNTPEFIEAVEYVKSFTDKNESLYDDSIEVVQGFTDDGALPMFIGGPWMINVINDSAPEIEGKWATAVLPKGDANNDSILGGTNLTVFSHSKVIDQSIEFLDYMSSAEAQENWFEATSTLPTNIKTWENNKELSENELLIPFGEQLKTAKPMPLTPKFEEIAQTWLVEFEKIYRDNAAVNRTVEDFNNQAAQIQGK